MKIKRAIAGLFAAVAVIGGVVALSTPAQAGSVCRPGYEFDWLCKEN